MDDENALEDYNVEAKDRSQIKVLREMSKKLSRIIELLENQGTIRPG